MKKYYDLVTTGQNAEICIYGDITSWPWKDGDASSAGMVQAIKALPENISNINIRINSYGGEVAEGLAIYNTLKTCGKYVTTTIDGFACSAASMIFMAGAERIINNSSLLMIHNALTYTVGNAEQLRKEADDLEKINEQIIKTYMEHVNITIDEVKKMMDDETWITPEEALEKGFASEIGNVPESENVMNSARKLIFDSLVQKQPLNKIENQGQIEVHLDEDGIHIQSTNEVPEQKTMLGTFLNAIIK
jgi:ATP-dependent Clp protease, proteolytic subunit ClpP